MGAGNVNNAAVNKGWLALVALATAQFLMVLDQSVMNVSISALVHDFHTTVTTIQAVITPVSYTHLTLPTILRV